MEFMLTKYLHLHTKCPEIYIFLLEKYPQRFSTHLTMVHNCRQYTYLIYLFGKKLSNANIEEEKISLECFKCPNHFLH